MTEGAVYPSTFPLFSNLAQELRDQIWQDALPESIGPALFLYREGCCCPRMRTESEEGYDAVTEENNLMLEFRHDLLDDFQFELPVAFVVHEARSIVLAWIREQERQGNSIKILPRKDGLCPRLMRHFNSMHDALYVPLDKWDNFLVEPINRLSEPDLINRNVDMCLDLTRIAVPELLFRTQPDTLPELFDNFYYVNTVLVVVGAQPDFQSRDDDSMKAYRWWEFESTQGEGGFFWNAEHRRFDFKGSKYISEKAIYRLIEEATQGLYQCLIQDHILSFEVRPVVAVRREI